MAAKAILICGKICSGKSTYAHKLKERNNAVLLSVDEITLAVFDGDLGEKHDEITKRIQKYIFEKSVQIIESGVTVILDWGFWRESDRRSARDFYENRNIPCELHYIDISEDTHRQNIAERNKSVSEGITSAYFIDEGLYGKFCGIFESPQKSEIDVLYRYERG